MHLIFFEAGHLSITKIINYLLKTINIYEGGKKKKKKDKKTLHYNVLTPKVKYQWFVMVDKEEEMKDAMQIQLKNFLYHSQELRSSIHRLTPQLLPDIHVEQTVEVILSYFFSK